MWNGKTGNYDSETGLWTIVGVDWNRTLQPGSYAEVGYCARAEIPPADPSTYDTPQISVDSSSNNTYVALRVSVTSQSSWSVPWEIEVDLADYVCASSLPETITAERATLTKISGTKYLLRGSTGDTRFVSASQPRNFVFAHYNPNGKEFRLGQCS